MADEAEDHSASSPEVEGEGVEAAEATAPAAESATGGHEEAAALPSGPVSYDFRSPALIGVPAMRKLRLLHEEFARSLATRLAIYLRMEFSAEVTDLKTQVCEDWIGGLDNPTHLTSFGIETLKGTGLIQMSPTLAMTMVDRLLGGPGKPSTPNRDLSEIEVVLVDEAIQLILKEWCPQMPLDARAKPLIIGHETNPRFIRPASDDAQMLVFALQLKMGELEDTIAVGFPYQMVELMLKTLVPVPEEKEEKEPVSKPREPVRWNPGLSEVKVPLTAEWGEIDIPAGRLARLRVGDTLEVDPDCINNVHVRLARVRKFVGRLGAAGKSRAIMLTEATRS